MITDLQLVTRRYLSADYELTEIQRDRIFRENPSVSYIELPDGQVFIRPPKKKEGNGK